MRQEYAKRILPFVQAAAEGKIVQYQDQNDYGNKVWCDTSVNHKHFAEDIEYRVKPELVVVYEIYTRPPGNKRWFSYRTCETQNDADSIVITAKSHSVYRTRLWKVVPVTIEE